MVPVLAGPLRRVMTHILVPIPVLIPILVLILILVLIPVEVGGPIGTDTHQDVYAAQVSEYLTFGTLKS